MVESQATRGVVKTTHDGLTSRRRMDLLPWPQMARRPDPRPGTDSRDNPRQTLIEPGQTLGATVLESQLFGTSLVQKNGFGRLPSSPDGAFHRRGKTGIDPIASQ